jgi:N-acetylmuramoyl-L-alanine amidase
MFSVKNAVPNRHFSSLNKNSKFVLLIAILFLVSCSSLNVDFIESNNKSNRIKLLVMHYTAIDYKKSLSALVNKGSGVSSHYLIPERNDESYNESDIKVLQLVDESERAWHAGSSYWQGRTDLNDQSIGIEIVNVPTCHQQSIEIDTDSEAEVEVEVEEQVTQQHQLPLESMCYYPDYDPEQIETLIKLTQDILKRNPDIGPTQIVGHSDIAPARKSDPGPRFPWQQLYQAGIGAWYDKDDVQKYWDLFISTEIPNTGLIQAALKTYGYQIIETGIWDKQTQDVVSAFQAHFIPWQVTGKADEQFAATLFALLDKYFPKHAEWLLARYERESRYQPEQEHIVKLGQVDQIFPQPKLLKNSLVNNRTTFKGYKDKGHLTLNNIDARSADIFINGKLLKMTENLSDGKQYTFPMAGYSVSGVNTLKVENVLPENSQINITIPFTTLVDKTAEHKKQFEAVDKLIEKDIEDGFPGAVLMVVRNGEIIKNSSYGYARKFEDGGNELTSPETMTTQHLFDIASNTKMFATNLALMKLNTEGKLDFNQTIQHYLPEYQGKGKDSILVKDLLTHSAGYAPEVKFFKPDNKLGERFYSQTPERTKRLLINKVPLQIGRNVRQVYSDTDYILLGVLVERITGMPLDQYSEMEIYRPLGLSHTKFNPLKKGFNKSQTAATEIFGNSRSGRISFPNIRTEVLQGEVHDEKAFYSLGGVAGHAGLFSTTGDLAVLTQLLLNRGGYGDLSMISSSVIDQFVKPSDKNGTYGLGWRRANNGNRKFHFGPYASPLAYGHTGWTGTVTVIDPEYDLAIILLTNARHSVIEGDEKHYAFQGKLFETGRYGSVISLVYEAILNNRSK